MTGTFQGRKGDRDYLASSSHEPFKGNRVTAVGDILGKTNKDAYKWICEHFGLDEKKIEKHERVVKAVESLQIVSHEATLNATHIYYSFGTEKLTDLLCPIERHDFIVLAGQVNSGKTTYTYWLAQDNALLGHKVYYFSLEMDPETIIKNMALSRAGITKREYTRRMVEPIPQVKQNDFYKCTKELREFPNLTIMGFRGGANVTWEVVKTKLDTITDADLFILDNLDMIKSDNEKDTDMARQERITQEIQGYTHNRQIPIILVHHYRKTNMDTTQEGPRSLDSLRGSGRIAANADMVLNVGRLMSPDISEDEKRKFLVHQIKARLFSTGSGEIYYYGGKFHDQDLPSMVQDVFSNNYYEPQSEL